MPIVQCRICQKEFYAKPNWLKRGWGKYCSRSCCVKGQLKGKLVLCDTCGKEIWKEPRDFRHSKSGKLFCSKKCQTLWRNKYFSGPNHPLWTGGDDKYRKTLLETKIPPVCVECGYKDEKVLVAHHIDGDRKNNELKNLRWLCRNCHYLVHGRETV